MGKHASGHASEGTPIMGITRLRGTARGRNRATAYDNLVFAVATAGRAGADLKAQTAAALADIEQALAAAGSDRTRLLQATVYLSDIRRKAEMDEAWNAWIGPDPETWPQRACVGVALAPGDLVEIAVVAARAAG
jgi:enamine deaminase RidA (YjgF/YER057c/UK114 family)